MGQLVAESADEIALIRAEENSPRSRERDGRAPGRGSTGGERVEEASVGDDDQAERTGIPAAQPGPVRRPIGELGQLGRHRSLGGPGHGRDPSHLDGRGRPLEQEGED